MTREVKRALHALDGLLAVWISKADKENQRLIAAMKYPVAASKTAQKSLEELESQIQAFFNAQKRAYRRAIRGMPALIQGAKTPVQKGDDPDKAIERFVGFVSGFVFADDAEYVSKLEELYAAFAAPLVASFAHEVAAGLNAAKAKDDAAKSLTKKADKWLSEHKIAFAREVQQTTHDAVIRCLRGALKSGDGITDAANDLIESLPRFFRQGKIKELRAALQGADSAAAFNSLSRALDDLTAFQHYRARRIAQHEILTACNAATLDGYRQSEVVMGKEWMCSCDERSRAAHIAADGQIVPVDEPFIVDGEKLMHPGDGSLGASASNVIGCRCTMRAKIRAQDDERDEKHG